MKSRRTLRALLVPALSLAGLAPLVAATPTPGQEPAAQPAPDAPGAQPAQPAQGSETAPARGVEDLPDLKRLVDESLRWLRAQQDPESGRYGDGVQETSWVVRAFARSPRGYTRQSGPFVGRALDYLERRQAESGAIHDAAVTDPGPIRWQTHWVAHALSDLSDPRTRAMLERARRFLGAEELGRPDRELTPESALAMAWQLVDERAEEGYWDADGGRLISTAQAIDDLTRAIAVLKQPSGAPRAASRLPRFEAADRAQALAAMQRGADFLLRTAEDGRWGAPGRPDAGLTAMAVGALEALPEPRPARVQDAIDAGLAWLVSLQHADGSIHDGKVANYTTSAAILALVAAEREAYAPVVRKARDFLVALQADESAGYSEGDIYYGGIGYGGDERPDLSNLQMALEALRASGLPEDDPTFQRALVFLQRCQNRSESNDAEVHAGATVVVSGDDGGSAYMPGDSPAGYVELADGRKVARSYGSMTYALLKSYLFAGLAPDDPRVVAAVEWIRANWTLDVNPGFEHLSDPLAAYQGLYYYFLTMAQALDLLGVEAIETPDGEAHDWRRELAGRLVVMQDPQSGSWINENSPRWWEGNPVLATSYALLALEAALPSE